MSVWSKQTKSRWSRTQICKTSWRRRFPQRKTNSQLLRWHSRPRLHEVCIKATTTAAGNHIRNGGGIQCDTRRFWSACRWCNSKCDRTRWQADGNRLRKWQTSLRESGGTEQQEWRIDESTFKSLRQVIVRQYRWNKENTRIDQEVDVALHEQIPSCSERDFLCCYQTLLHRWFNWQARINLIQGKPDWWDGHHQAWTSCFETCAAAPKFRSNVWLV